MVAAKVATIRQGQSTDLASIDAKLSQDDTVEPLTVDERSGSSQRRSAYTFGTVRGSARLISISNISSPIIFTREGLM